MQQRAGFIGWNCSGSLSSDSFLQSASFQRQTQLWVPEKWHSPVGCIVVDCSLTGGSLDVIRKYESELVWRVSGSDLGQADSINHGLAEVSGKIRA